MFKRYSLGTQLVFVTSGLLILLISLFSWLNIESQSRDLRGFFDRQASALAYTISISSSTSLLESNFAELEALLLKAERFETLESASITDTEGNVIARVVRGADGSLSPDYELERMVLSTSTDPLTSTKLLKSPRQLTVIEPVKAGNLIGYATLEFDLTPINANNKQLIGKNVGIALGMGALVLGVLLWFVRQPVVQLKRLTQFAESLAQSRGQLDDLQFSATELESLRSTLNWASRKLDEYTRSLEVATGQARAASELKSQFLANMSHEIRTPLNGILGLSEVVLSSDSLPTKERRHVELILNSAENLLRVVNDILDFSKIEANKLDLDLHPFHLRRQINSILIPLKSKLKNPAIKLNVQIDAHVEDHFEGDSGRLNQVLNNLLGNALKFTQQGSVDLLVGVVESDQQTQSDFQTIRFTVQDTGIGMSPASLQKIFEAFTQAESSTTRRFGGTGLGLSISQRLVNMMGGQISVSSQEGQGSCFSFCITLKVLSRLAHAEKTGQALEALGTPPAPDSSNKTDTMSHLLATRGIRVLVAEDNAVNQTFVSYVLSQLGISFKICEDGQEAFEACQTADFDLVLMDLHMPRLSGLEATRKILEIKPATTIVGLSADAVSGTREICIEAGMKDYLTKPFKKAELEVLLQSLSLPYKPVPMNNFDQDSDIMKSTAQAIVSELPNHLARIEASLDQKDYITAHRAVHTLKGHVSLFGEDGLTQFLESQEATLKDHRPISPLDWSFMKANLMVFKERLSLLTQ